MLSRTTLGLALACWLASGSLGWAEGVLVGPPPCASAEGPGCHPPPPLPLLPPPPPPVVLPPADPPPPIVTVKVRVPACAAPGEEIEYRICVENCSPADAHHVLVKNPLPANARFVRASPEPTQIKPELQWSFGTMHGGDRRQIVLVLAPTDLEDVHNCARVQFEHGQCVTTRVARALPGMPGGPGHMPGVPDGTVPPDKVGDGKITLTMSGPKEQYANLDAQYFLTVANTGKTRATNVALSARLPAELTFVSADAEGKFLEGQVAWYFKQLEPGDHQTVKLIVRPQTAGKFCIAGRALADRGLMDVAEVCTLFRGASALHPALVDRKDPVAVGEDASYLIRLVNQGSVPLTNVRVKGLLPDSLSLIQLKGADLKALDKGPDGTQTFLFDVKEIAVGATLEVEVLARALRPGDARFQFEASADQLEGGPVIQQDATTIFSEPPPPRKE